MFLLKRKWMRGETIEESVRCIAPGPPPSIKQMYVSCIQGYGGENVLNRGDEAYNNITPSDIEMILEDKHCARPCLSNKDRSACSNLTPGPFNRLMYALLAKV